MASLNTFHSILTLVKSAGIPIFCVTSCKPCEAVEVVVGDVEAVVVRVPNAEVVNVATAEGIARDDSLADRDDVVVAEALIVAADDFEMNAEPVCTALVIVRVPVALTDAELEKAFD